MLRSLKSQLHSYKPCERDVKEATSSVSAPAPDYLLHRIALATFAPDDFRLTMNFIWKRLHEPDPKFWMHVYKALILLEYLAIHGAENALQEVKAHMYHMHLQRDYVAFDKNGMDQGINVREKAKTLLALLGDDGLLAAERARAGVTYSRQPVLSHSLRSSSSNEFTTYTHDNSSVETYSPNNTFHAAETRSSPSRPLEYTNPGFTGPSPPDQSFGPAVPLPFSSSAPSYPPHPHMQTQPPNDFYQEPPVPSSNSHFAGTLRPPTSPYNDQINNPQPPSSRDQESSQLELAKMLSLEEAKRERALRQQEEDELKFALALSEQDKGGRKYSSSSYPQEQEEFDYGEIPYGLPLPETTTNPEPHHRSTSPYYSNSTLPLNSSSSNFNSSSSTRLSAPSSLDTRLRGLNNQSMHTSASDAYLRMYSSAYQDQGEPSSSTLPKFYPKMAPQKQSHSSNPFLSDDSEA